MPCRTACTGRSLVQLSALLIPVLTTVGRGRAIAQTPTTAPADVLPSAVDLRPIFKKWELPVRSQGARGTCSVFVVTDALEYALASQRHSVTRLSVEFLNWASDQALGKADDGGNFADLWKGFAAYGVCPEPELPYQPAFDPKLSPSEDALQHARVLRDAGLRLHWIKPWDVKTGLTDAQLSTIKRTLAWQWPVCGGLRWPKAEKWDSDVLQMAPPDGVRDGHSVLLVGYQDDPQQPGGGVFLIRNSGRSTRDGRMTYEYARTYMNDAMWIDFEPAAATRPSAPVKRDSPASGGGAP